ncbi:MAG: AAA family ATPase [Deltaproteobacteria bacterium]|nr:AAA family ATPase [Deltaproteobacteria bacterium]
MPIVIQVTSVGHCPDKTLVAAAALRRLGKLGHRALGVKPVETGCLPDENHELVPADGMLLAEASAPVAAPLSIVAPYRFSEAVRPADAMAHAGLVVTIADLCEQVREAARHADVLVIEGGAGATSPIATDGNELDLALMLRAALAIVVPPGADPGAVAETIEIARTRGVAVGGVVVLGAEDVQADLRVVGVPACVTPPLSGPRSERVATLERLFEQHGFAEVLLAAAQKRA